MRKGRYKKNLLLESECPAFAERFSPPLQEMKELFAEGHLTESQFVAGYFLKALQILKPTSWKGGRLRQGSPTTDLETFEIFSMRGIPLSANRTLSAWNAGEYRLQLFFDVPSTTTVLELQSQGVRCVTCIVDEVALSRYVLAERDPVSFLLHDLIHADHFLRDPLQKQVQVGFSRWMRDLWSSSSLQEALLNPQFRNQFEYACADMNSHGAHLVKYLKAVFCQAGQETWLLKAAENQQFSPAFQTALEALNTSRETSEHLEILQRQLFLNGSATRENQKDDRVVLRELPAT